MEPDEMDFILFHPIHLFFFSLNLGGMRWNQFIIHFILLHSIIKYSNNVIIILFHSISFHSILPINTYPNIAWVNHLERVILFRSQVRELRFWSRSCSYMALTCVFDCLNSFIYLILHVLVIVFHSIFAAYTTSYEVMAVEFAQI